MLQRIKRKIGSLLQDPPPAWEITMRLELTVEAQWAGLRDKTRNMIRKHERLEREVYRDKCFTDAFYTLYHARMESKGAKAKNYFELFNVLQEEGVELYAEFDGFILKGGAVVDMRDKESATWLVGALTSEFLLWEVVKDCIQDQKKCLYLGRSRAGSGSFYFKRNFCGHFGLIEREERK